MKKSTFAIVFMLILGLVAAYGVRRYLQGGEPTFNLNQAGKEAPAFSLPSIKEGNIKLADHKGKVVLVNFWASWCPPCRAEIPGFIKVQKAYKDKPFTIIGIAIEDQKASSSYADEIGINYPVAYGLDESLKVAGLYGDPDGALPYSVLIGPDQKILSVFSGFLSEDKLKEMIDKNLP